MFKKMFIVKEIFYDVIIISCAYIKYEIHILKYYHFMSFLHYCLRLHLPG